MSSPGSETSQWVRCPICSVHDWLGVDVTASVRLDGEVMLHVYCEPTPVCQWTTGHLDCGWLLGKNGYHRGLAYLQAAISRLKMSTAMKILLAFTEPFWPRGFFDVVCTGAWLSSLAGHACPSEA